MGEPNSEVFHGRTVTNRFVILFFATRPPFLTASIFPVVTALALVWGSSGGLDVPLALLTLLNVALIHSAANVLNDYFDARNGGDEVNVGRFYPFSGGSRFIQNGILTQRQTWQFGTLLMVAGVLLGLYMVYLKGSPILMIGLVGVALAVFYSAPPCLACRGMGDLVIAICFGVLPVIGTAYLQLSLVPEAAWWLGGIIGCFVAAILWVNSIPDIEADTHAGKMTLPVLFGARRAYYGLPIWMGLGFLLLTVAPLPYGGYLGLLAVVPGAIACRTLIRGRVEEAIPLTLATHASVALLLTVGLLS